MRLMEETVKEQNPFTSCGSAIAVKIKEQQEIDELKKQFYRSGGKTTVIESPIAVLDPKPKPLYGVYSDMEDKRRNGQDRQRQAKSGRLKYIMLRQNRLPQVNINGMYEQ